MRDRIIYKANHEVFRMDSAASAHLKNDRINLILSVFEHHVYAVERSALV